MCKGKFLLNNVPGDLEKNTESVTVASMCKEKYILNVSGDLDIYATAVTGAVSVGLSYSKLDKLLWAIDLPMMTEPMYQKQHEFVSNAWEKALGQSSQLETKSVPADFFTSSVWQRICCIAGHSRSPVNDVESNIVECFHSFVAKLVGGKK
ncbi:unnamed protein product [Parnassius apollo]|uniref:(apollo) hypothetical protein n=1 Tax=Parnassius apollo TaxID=110799 RepID=A0A8S3XIR1_PARAO|nr:unnamed protein product [Parnassius apollo]